MIRYTLLIRVGLIFIEMMGFLLFSSFASKSAVTPKFHTIQVGEGGNFMYSPNATYAEVGDVVIFNFFPTNHSVVRGEYTESKACGEGGCNPCIPYELIHPGQPGFASGNVLTQELMKEGKTFNITIASTSPIWFYCTALLSCHPNGMVGVINPTNGTSVEKQWQAAVNAPFQLLPGDLWPAEGATPNSDSGANPQPSATNHYLPSSGAIAGITVSAFVTLALLAALFYFIGCFKRDANASNQPNVGRKALDESGNVALLNHSVKNISDPRSVPILEYLPESTGEGIVSPLSPTSPHNNEYVRNPISSGTWMTFELEGENRKVAEVE